MKYDILFPIIMVLREKWAGYLKGNDPIGDTSMMGGRVTLMIHYQSQKKMEVFSTWDS